MLGSGGRLVSEALGSWEVKVKGHSSWHPYAKYGKNPSSTVDCKEWTWGIIFYQCFCMSWPNDLEDTGQVKSHYMQHILACWWSCVPNMEQSARETFINTIPNLVSNSGFFIIVLKFHYSTTNFTSPNWFPWVTTAMFSLHYKDAKWCLYWYIPKQTRTKILRQTNKTVFNTHFL